MCLTPACIAMVKTRSDSRSRTRAKPGRRGKSHLDEVLNEVENDGLVREGHERLRVGESEGTQAGTEAVHERPRESAIGRICRDEGRGKGGRASRGTHPPTRMRALSSPGILDDKRSRLGCGVRAEIARQPCVVEQRGAAAGLFGPTAGPETEVASQKTHASRGLTKVAEPGRG